MKKIHNILYSMLLLLGLQNMTYSMFKTMGAYTAYRMLPSMKYNLIQVKKQYEAKKVKQLKNQYIAQDFNAVLSMDDVQSSVVGDYVLPPLCLAAFVLWVVSEFQQNEWKNLIKGAIPVDKNSEIYKVFEQVKLDCGIQEEIPLLVSNSLQFNKNGLSTLAVYVRGIKVIVLNNRYIQELDQKEDKSMLIKTFAHELEHYKQNNKYIGSCHDRKSRHLEHGADAAAAGYIDCQYCLESAAQKSGHQVQQGCCDGISTKKGYFANRDYESYIKRAKTEGAVCKGHEKILFKDQRIMWNTLLDIIDSQPAIYDTTSPTFSDFLPGR